MPITSSPGCFASILPSKQVDFPITRLEHAFKERETRGMHIHYHTLLARTAGRCIYKAKKASAAPKAMPALTFKAEAAPVNSDGGGVLGAPVPVG
jgi:hypothetical protein